MCLEFSGIRASVNILWYILCFPFPSDLVSAPTLLLYYPRAKARAPLPPRQPCLEGLSFGLLTAVPLPTGGVCGDLSTRALLSSLVHTMEFLPMHSVLYTDLLPAAHLSEAWPRSRVWPEVGIAPPVVRDRKEGRR